MSEVYNWIPTGWIPDPPDFRDWPYKLEASSIPDIVDLRSYCSPVENQLSLGSCSSNATVGMLECVERIKSRGTADLSRLFLFYNARVLGGTLENGDPTYGTYLRDNVKVAATIGAPHEATWPYQPSKWSVKPSKDSYSRALAHRVDSYYRISDLNRLEQIKDCLASGYPIVFGFNIYQSFMVSNGSWLGPAINEQPITAHAVLIVGYNALTEMFILRNSWGPEWGNAGYFELPFAFVADPNQASDFWTIRSYYTPPVIVDTPVDPGAEPQVQPLYFEIIPEANIYNEAKQLYLVCNSKEFPLEYSIDGSPYEVYTGPITLDRSMSVSYKRDTLVKTANYIYEPNPLELSVVPPPGTYKSMTLAFISNKACKIFYMIGSGPKLEYSEPIKIESSTYITYYGEANGITYPSKSIKYVIDPLAPAVSIYPQAIGAYQQDSIKVTLTRSDL